MADAAALTGATTPPRARGRSTAGLTEVFATARAEHRAALIGYLPAGYPTRENSADMFSAMIDAGCDLVEVGVPYSDPVMDGPVIQAAAETARSNGFKLADLFGIVEKISARGGKAVLMSYFNPILAYGPDRFARDLAAAGGLGVITPDLIVDEAEQWLQATASHGIDPIFLVAPSSPADRIARTVASTQGFLYAASTMGVTGARDQVGSLAPDLVARCRTLTDLPIGVGLGVRTGAQAAEIAGYADAVIVGSAFVSAVTAGEQQARTLAEELAAGVRGNVVPGNEEGQQTR